MRASFHVCAVLSQLASHHSFLISKWIALSCCCEQVDTQPWVCLATLLISTAFLLTINVGWQPCFGDNGTRGVRFPVQYPVSSTAVRLDQLGV